MYLSGHKLMLEHGRMSPLTDKVNAWRFLISPLKVIFTFHLVALTWIFFRAGSFHTAWLYTKGILTWQQLSTIPALNWFGGRVTLLIAVLFVIEMVQYWAKDQTIMWRLGWVTGGFAYGALLVLIFALGGVYSEVPFIYFQF